MADLSRWRRAQQIRDDARADQLRAELIDLATSADGLGDLMVAAAAAAERQRLSPQPAERACGLLLSLGILSLLREP